jgi:hypothetical protein
MPPGPEPQFVNEREPGIEQYPSDVVGRPAGADLGPRDGPGQRMEVPAVPGGSVERVNVGAAIEAGWDPIPGEVVPQAIGVPYAAPGVTEALRPAGRKEVPHMQAGRDRGGRHDQRRRGDVVWYRRTFVVPSDFRGATLLLHFGAVDYAAQVFVDGQYVGGHEGGHTPFALDITAVVASAPGAPHVIVLRAEDRAVDLTQPRGKQYWKDRSESIFYTRTTGIWQSVWLEPVGPIYCDTVWCTPSWIDGSVTWRVRLGGGGVLPGDLRFAASVRDEQGVYGVADVPVDSSEFECTITVTPEEAGALRPWSPERPFLYDVRYRLYRGDETLDDVESYLGFRQVAVRDGQLELNGRPYFLKMVLDQGYFPGGLLTAPRAEDLRRDVELCKAMGFNGVRKHQKVEDPLWLYWCDRLGLLVWAEMANAYRFTPSAVGRLTREWVKAVERDYNHPSIMAWVPINESWGVPHLEEDGRQWAYLDALYALTRALDATRLVVSNDGWEHTAGDLCTIHDYAKDPEVLEARYGSLEAALEVRPSERALYAPTYGYRGEPVLVTEMGGISFEGQHGWGYSVAKSGDDFLRRYQALVAALARSPVVQGFCYTQLTDVEQEINGLLTDGREPKVDLAAIRRANEVGRE